MVELEKSMLEALTADCKTPGDVEKLFSQMLQNMINCSLEAELRAKRAKALVEKTLNRPASIRSRGRPRKSDVLPDI